ncbi:YaiO family outer membrane beta-barrel protein [Maribacter luteus]|uniref:YaiO family outer membrane beta-barrel protein n=1 Tax=Maribacter luteus TaxID=2594478 RepID=A0A6I2MJP0_9FLAO|nr:YaiO family outer membrane beta-barrel protein [Maribacter luteus]MRX63983.1 YaiO family outer membrane beta-barrel protein [Maribacter luteus]
MKIKRTYLILLGCFFGFLGLAQEREYKGNPDESLLTARELAFNGKHAIAQDTLNLVLTKYPNYNDVRNLLASTYSWDGDYDEARKQFNKITSIDKKNKETWIAAIKNEIYAKEYYIALGLANKAIRYIKDDDQLTALRTEILKHTPGSIETFSEKPDENTGKSILEEKVYKNSIAISNSYDVFDKAYDPMIYSSLEYKRATKIGSIIPRINFSNRFQTNGIQYELDAYPKFSKKIYAYTNYAFSDAPTFPNHRVGAELYANLPKSMEISAGVRYLDFKTTQTNIITGSLGMYRGNYYISARPYISLNKDRPVGVSGTILGRKYLKDGENYFGIMAGYGYSADLRQLRDGDELLAETILYVESQQLNLEYQFSGKKQPHLYKANLGLTRQELAYDSGNFYWAVSVGFTYYMKF